MKNSGLWILTAIFLAGLYLYLSTPPEYGGRSKTPATTVSVKLPEQLSPAAKIGQGLFTENCAPCHGQNASGGDAGPPLVHKIYEPSHHSDFSFYRAVKFGVAAHHWKFGNMPPVKGVSEVQAKAIVQYVRELQKANGIF